MIFSYHTHSARQSPNKRETSQTTSLLLPSNFRNHLRMLSACPRAVHALDKVGEVLDKPHHNYKVFSVGAENGWVS